MSHGRLWLIAAATAILACGLALALLLRQETPDAPTDWDAPAGRGEAAAARPGPEDRGEVSGAAFRREELDPARNAAAASKPAPAGTGGIKGRVLLADRTPLAGTEVRAYVCRRSSWTSPHRLLLEPGTEPAVLLAASGRTDREGSFLLERVPAQVALLLSVGPQTARATVRFLESALRNDEVKDAGDVVLDIGSVLTGKLVDADARPVASARVRVFERLTALTLDRSALWSCEGGAVGVLGETGAIAVCELPAWSGPLERELSFPEAVTDASGRFRLEGLVAERPALWVQQAGFVPVLHGPVSLTQGKERDTGDIVLPRARVAAGRVLDPGGRPVAGAQVLAGEVGDGELVFLRRLAPADQDGSVKIEHAGAKLVLAARRAPGEAWTAFGPLAGDGPFELRLAEARTLEVSVSGSGQEPLRGVQLEATSAARVRGSEGPFLPLPPATHVARLGEAAFRIVGLGPGGIRLVASAPGRVPSARVVDLGAAAPEPVRFSLAPASDGKLIVLEEGTKLAVPAAAVSVTGDVLGGDENGFPSDVFFPLGATNAGGELVLRQLPPGTHRVLVRHPRFGCSAFPVTLPGAPATVYLRTTGSLAGKVLERGRPPRFPVRVALRPDSDVPIHEDGWLVLLPVAADGSFRADGLTPATYEVMFSPDPAHVSTLHFHLDLAISSQSTRSQQVEIVSGKETTVTLEIVPAGAREGPIGTVKGRVLQNGRPAADLEVLVEEDRTLTDQAGRFELTKVQAGAIRLTVHSKRPPRGVEEWPLVERTLTLREGEVLDLELAVETAAARGRFVLVPDQKPLASRAVFFLPAQGSSPHLSAVHFQLDENGAFELPELAAGTYWALDAEEEYVPTGAGPLILGAGTDSREVEVTMSRGLSITGRVHVEPLDSIKPDRWWVEMLHPKTGHRRIFGLENDGTFAAAGLARGKYEASLLSDNGRGHEPLPVELEGPRTAVELRFKKRK